MEEEILGRGHGEVEQSMERWIFLGVKGTSGELIVGDQDGVWRTRPVRRKPEENRWKVDNMKMIVGLPWRKKKNETDPQVDGEELRGNVIKMDGSVMGRDEMTEVRDVIDKAASKTFGTKKEDYEKHGYSQGCPGCRAVLTGTTRQKHTEKCRRRMEGEMQDLERVKVAKRRREEFFQKAIKTEEDNREGRATTSTRGASSSSSGPTAVVKMTDEEQGRLKR